MKASFRERKPAEGEDEYEAIISYCLNMPREPELIEKIPNGPVANQQNHNSSQCLAQQLANKVFSNEWMIMPVLFSITVALVLFRLPAYCAAASSSVW